MMSPFLPITEPACVSAIRSRVVTLPPSGTVPVFSASCAIACRVDRNQTLRNGVLGCYLPPPTKDKSAKMVASLICNSDNLTQESTGIYCVNMLVKKMLLAIQDLGNNRPACNDEAVAELDLANYRASKIFFICVASSFRRLLPFFAYLQYSIVDPEQRQLCRSKLDILHNLSRLNNDHALV